MANVSKGVKLSFLKAIIEINIKKVKQLVFIILIVFLNQGTHPCGASFKH